jgi:hypothetical protein
MMQQRVIPIWLVLAEIMRTSILEEGSREIDTVLHDENIRFPMHLPDGSRLKNMIKDDHILTLLRGVQGSRQSMNCNLGSRVSGRLR